MTTWSTYASPHVGKIDAIPPASPHIVHIYRKKCAARRVMYDSMLLAASANVVRSTLPCIFRLRRRILRIPAGAFASRLARALLLGDSEISAIPVRLHARRFPVGFGQHHDKRGPLLDPRFTLRWLFCPPLLRSVVGSGAVSHIGDHRVGLGECSMPES